QRYLDSSLEQIILQRTDGIDVLLITNQVQACCAGVFASGRNLLRLLSEFRLNNSLEVFEFDLEQFRTVVRSETVLQIVDESLLAFVLGLQTGRHPYQSRELGVITALDRQILLQANDRALLLHFRNDAV